MSVVMALTVSGGVLRRHTTFRTGPMQGLRHHLSVGTQLLGTSPPSAAALQ